MKHILIFPGQGFQNIDMLSSEVQQFCLENGLYNLLNEVLKDNSKIFDTKYAQPLIVATQLAECKKYMKNLEDEDEVIFAGLSLGEITALIASGVISIEEGLEFVKRRGEESKKFSENKLQSYFPKSSKQHIFGVARLKNTKELEKAINDWNSTHMQYEQVNITNYLPAISENHSEDVMITGEYEMLEKNIQVFGGKEGQKLGKMQCPFHTSMLSELADIQDGFFHEIIKSINAPSLPQVFSTKTGKFYDEKASKESISKELAGYIVEPMQTTKTLEFFRDKCSDYRIVVTMSKGFSDKLAKQYMSIGGKENQIGFIGDFRNEGKKAEKAIRE